MHDNGCLASVGRLDRDNRRAAPQAIPEFCVGPAEFLFVIFWGDVAPQTRFVNPVAIGLPRAARGVFMGGGRVVASAWKWCLA